MAYKCGSCGTFFTGKVCPVCGVRSPVAMIGRPRDLAVARQEQLTPCTSDGGAKPAVKKKPKQVFPEVPDPSIDTAKKPEKKAPAETLPEKPDSVKKPESAPKPSDETGEKKDINGIFPADKAKDEPAASPLGENAEKPKDTKKETARSEDIKSEAEKPKDEEKADVKNDAALKPAEPSEKNLRTPAIPDFSTLPKPPRPESESKPKSASDGMLNKSWGDTPAPPPDQVAKAVPAGEKNGENDAAKSAEKKQTTNALPRFDPVPVSLVAANRERKRQNAASDDSAGFFRAASAAAGSLLRGDGNAAANTVLERPASWRLGIFTLPICAVTTSVVCQLHRGVNTAQSFFGMLGRAFLLTLLAAVVLAFVFLILDPASRARTDSIDAGRSGKAEKKGASAIARAFAASALSLTAPAVFGLPAIAAELFFPALTAPLMTTGCGLCFALFYQTVNAAAVKAGRKRLIWFALAMIPAVFAIYRFASFILF